MVGMAPGQVLMVLEVHRQGVNWDERHHDVFAGLLAMVELAGNNHKPSYNQAIKGDALFRRTK